MFELREINSKEATKFFINDPKLCYKGLSDNELVQIHQNKKYVMSPRSYYRGLFIEGEHLCIFKYEYVDKEKTNLNIHFYLSSKLHGTRVIQDIIKYLHVWVMVNYTSVTKLSIYIPAACRHALITAKKAGFKEEQRIPKATMWRKELVDVIIMGEDLEWELNY